MGEINPTRTNAAGLYSAHKTDEPVSPSIKEAGKTPMAAFLNGFFKDSPWHVTTKKLMGKEWYVWQRVEGGKTQQPMIYLAPVDENNPPFIYRTPAKDSSDLLVMEIPQSTIELFIDKDDTLKPKETANTCSFPTYIIIPQDATAVQTIIFLNARTRGSTNTITVMGLELQEGTHPDEYGRPIPNDEYAYLRKNGTYGIYRGVDSRCLFPPPPPPPPPPEDDKTQKPIPLPEPAKGGKMPPFPYGEVENTCLIMTPVVPLHATASTITTKRLQRWSQSRLYGL